MKCFLFMAALACAPIWAASDDDRLSTWGHSNGHAYVRVFGTRASRTAAGNEKVSACIAGMIDGMLWMDPKAEAIPTMDTDRMVEYLDLFYANPLNRVIPVGAVFVFARMREDGKIEDELVEASISYLRNMWMKDPPKQGKEKYRSRLTL